MLYSNPAIQWISKFFASMLSVETMSQSSVSSPKISYIDKYIRETGYGQSPHKVPETPFKTPNGQERFSISNILTNCCHWNDWLANVILLSIIL